jgi:hypothetical protein
MGKGKKRKTDFSKVKLGALGSHSKGKIHKDDEGDIQMAIGSTEDGKVVVDFGKAVAWVGMDPDNADELANMLRRHATNARIALKAAAQNRKMN